MKSKFYPKRLEFVLCEVEYCLSYNPWILRHVLEPIKVFEILTYSTHKYDPLNKTKKCRDRFGFSIKSKVLNWEYINDN